MLPLLDSVCMVITTACIAWIHVLLVMVHVVYALTACTVCIDVYACTADGGIHMITWDSIPLHSMHGDVYIPWICTNGYLYTWCGDMHGILLV